MNLLDEIFSQRLREALAQRGISQRQMAKDMNTSPTTIQRWCQGQSPTSSNIVEIATYLRVKPQWLFGADDSIRDSMILRGISYLQKIEDTGDIEGILEIMESLIDRQAEDKLKKNQKKKPV